MSLCWSLEHYISDNKLITTQKQEPRVKEILQNLPVQHIYIEGGSEIDNLILAADSPAGVTLHQKYLEIIPSQNVTGAGYQNHGERRAPLNAVNCCAGENIIYTDSRKNIRADLYWLRIFIKSSKSIKNHHKECEVIVRL